MDLATFLLIATGTFVIIMGGLIVLHELGHYLTARAFGLKPQCFSIGFGPELAGFTDRHGTRWKIAPILFGGYVKFHGEMHPGVGSKEDQEHPESFAKLPRWQRSAIIAAGPLANLLISAVIFLSLFAFYGVPTVSSDIQQIAPGSAAQKAGLQPGDQILSFNGQAHDGDQDLIRFIRLHPGEPLLLSVSREGNILEKRLDIQRVEMVDRFGNEASIGQLGVVFGREFRKPDGVLDLIASTSKETASMVEIQFVTLSQMVRGVRPLHEVSGPVRLAKFSGEQFLMGWTALINFTAIISCCLAFMNLLPIPGLDGGYLLLYGIEAVKRKTLSKESFGRSIMVGYVMVGFLTVFGFANDLRVLFG